MYMKKAVKKDKELINTILPKLTSNQKQLLFYFYQFRFLHTQQIQKLFNHKDPRMVQIWLKDLKEKGYIQRQYFKDTFENHAKPAVYFLTLQARQFLKNNKNYNLDALDKLYKEKKRTESFIHNCLTLVDIYLYFVLNKKKAEKISFYTENQLLQYDSFPKEYPDAYIVVKTKGNTKRYFLELFEDYVTARVLQSRLKAYVQYADEGKWEDNADGEEFPMVLFVCPTENLSKHICYYAKALFEKTYEEPFSLFLTSKDIILNSENGDVWRKVEVE